MLQALQELHLPDIERQTSVPPVFLLVSEGDPRGRNLRNVSAVEQGDQKAGVAHHCRAILAGQPPFASEKMKRYVNWQAGTFDARI